MTIDIRDGQPQLSDLLDLMAAGDEVLIVEGDRQLVLQRDFYHGG
jgi:antitoxin (DNA-binding transcriptional repressor) of toxin-antitoxin stability system